MIAAALVVVALLVAGFSPGPIGRARDYVATSLAMDVGAPSGGRTYVPAPAADPPLARIAAIGDVGTGDDEERATAAEMAGMPGIGYDALVLLGDNVYPSGNPDRLDATVFTPFADVLDQGAQLLAALGNHDVQSGYGDDQAQALGMPARWYSWSSGPVEVIVLDTTRAQDPLQWAWLEQTLSSSVAIWKIVAMHHPPYSAGWHGSSEGVRDTFEPLFNQYGVQLVLAGHDHDYQRSEAIDGTTYVVSGAGSRTRPTSRADFTAVSWSTQHFVDIQVWDDHLLLQAVAQDGLVYDTVELLP